MATATKKKTEDLDVIQAIAAEVVQERVNQVQTWGQQDHPSSFGETARQYAEDRANEYKWTNAARVAGDVLTWDGILLEEVYEALAEKDDARRREELVQVAAVALAEIEAIDRRVPEKSPLDELAGAMSTDDADRELEAINAAKNAGEDA